MAAFVPRRRKLAGAEERQDKLVIADAGVIAAPPVTASGSLRAAEQPRTIIAGVVIRAIDPNPNAVAEDPVTIEVVELVVVMVVHGNVLVVVAMHVFSVQAKGGTKVKEAVRKRIGEPTKESTPNPLTRTFGRSSPGELNRLSPRLGEQIADQR